MADSADDLLAQVRAVSRRTFMSNGLDDRRAVTAFAELDALLSSGATLPSAWEREPGVIHIVQHMPDVTDGPQPEDVSRLAARYRSQGMPALAALSAAQVSAPVIRDADTVAATAVRTLNAANRSLAEKDAEIARLTAELDDARNVPVEYVPTSGIEAAMAADPDRLDGSVLREMGGDRRAWAWKAAAKEWEQVT